MINTLCVGVSAKDSERGNLEVSCCVKIELDEQQFGPDSDIFLETVRQAYSACRRAVTSELRQNGMPGE
jgi:hypothetical protein